MEIWELVTSDGKPSGVLYERESGKPFPDGLFFRVVEVWVRVSDKLLVTRRHPRKWAGLKWEVSGGGVLYTETISEAAARELFEETGIKASPDELIHIGTNKHPPAYVDSFLLTLDDTPEVILDPEEVVDYKFVTKSEFIEMGDEFNNGTRVRFEKYSDIIFKDEE